VALEGIEITGGRNGVSALGASGLTVRNAEVRSVGRTGIFLSGSSATIDGASVLSSGRDGMAVDGGQATIIDSTISGSARNGMVIAAGGGARIGVTALNEAAGNTISENTMSGIVVATGSAFIAMNRISGNGGVGLRMASAILATRSNLQLSSSTIQGNRTVGNNQGDGVRMFVGSTLQVTPAAGAPFPIISGNEGWGVQCFDSASIVLTNGASIFGNALGDVSC
jgi:hypothetical protein